MVLAVLPYALGFPVVGRTAKEKLRQKLDISLDFNRLAWSWWPQPSVSFYSLRVNHSRTKVTAPRGALRADWSGLVRGKSAFKLYLEEPEIRVTSLAPMPASGDALTTRAKPTLAPLSSFVAIEVKNAHVWLPSDGILAGMGPEAPCTEIMNLDAKVLMAPEYFEFTGRCRLSLAESLRAEIELEKRASGPEAPMQNYWHLDIKGQNVDLTAARKKVLRLFGKDAVVRQVCHIVQGGRARTASYSFQGFTEDFERLEAMRIAALTEGVAVVIPEMDLPLQQASGPVEISQGVLTGQSLSATLNNSRVSGAKLSLELTGRNRQLDLTADFDAALADIPGLLRTHVFQNNQVVVAELAGIEKAEGRVAGRLKIDGSLNNLPVEVTVRDSDGSASYRRFRDRAGIREGVLTFYPDHLTWRAVEGFVGPHRINSSSGSVFWKEGVRLDVSALDAEVKTGNMLAQLRDWPVFAQEVRPLLRSAKGPLKIHNMRLKGPVGPLEKMSYRVDVEMENLHLDSPLLPEPLLIRTGKTCLKSGKFFASDCHLDIAGPDMEVLVDMDRISRFTPDAWVDSRGKLVLRGRLNTKTARWVRDHQWIPSAYFPRTPCRLDPMVISFDEKAVGLRGNLVTPRKSAPEITTSMDIALGSRKVVIEDLTVTSDQENAGLKVVFEPFPDPNIYLRFTGRLTKETADAILEDNMLLAESVQGDCRIQYFFDSPEARQLSGSLVVNGINIYARDNVFSVQQAAISGHESYADIETALISFNQEAMSLEGRLAMRNGSGLEADLSLRSPHISYRNLERMLALVTGKKIVDDNASAANAYSPPAITGRIDFQVKQFAYTPDRKDSEHDNTYLWQDLGGRVEMRSGQPAFVTIEQGNICGLETTGTLRRPPGKSIVKVSAGQTEEADFQEVLSCLGIGPRKLTGRFQLEASLSGTPGNWSDGYLNLVSHKGEIKKLAIMSKLFAVINVTDMLSISGLKNLFSTGYPYSTIQLTGTIADNQLHLANSFIKGSGLDFFFSGTVALDAGELDLLLFVKPFGMIDAIVTTVPLVGKDLGGGNQSIMFLPLHVGGDVRDPKITLLSQN